MACLLFAGSLQNQKTGFLLGNSNVPNRKVSELHGGPTLHATRSLKSVPRIDRCSSSLEDFESLASTLITTYKGSSDSTGKVGREEGSEVYGHRVIHCFDVYMNVFIYV